MSELMEIKPCPFCGTVDDIDLKGWRDGEGNVGPQCIICGSTALSLEVWNTRTVVIESEES